MPSHCRLLLLTFASLLPACEQSAPPSPPPPTTSAPAALTARETIERLRHLHHERQYQELRQLIVPARANDVVTTLMAADEFLDANRALCHWIRDQVGIGLAQRIDQSYFGDRLDVFSRDIQLLDATARHNAATVSFTVADQLPVHQAHLRRVNLRWRYDPGEGYSTALPAAFRELARGLESVLVDLKAGRLAPADLRDEPQRLVDRVRNSLRPGVRLLSEARTAAES